MSGKGYTIVKNADGAYTVSAPASASFTVAKSKDTAGATVGSVAYTVTKAGGQPVTIVKHSRPSASTTSTQTLAQVKDSMTQWTSKWQAAQKQSDSRQTFEDMARLVGEVASLVEAYESHFPGSDASAGAASSGTNSVAEARIKAAIEGSDKSPMLELDKLELFEVPKSIANLTNVFSLILVENNLSSLPDCFKNFNQISLIYLNYNKFTEFPEVLGSMKSLTMIEFTHNKLTSIPDCIGELNEIEILKISDNEIETISKNIAKCTKLSILMMENNKIDTGSFPFAIRHLDLSMLTMDDDLCDLFDHENLDPMTEKTRNKIGDFCVMIGAESDYFSQFIVKPKAKAATKEGQAEDKIQEILDDKNDRNPMLKLEKLELTQVPASIAKLTNLFSLILSDNKLSSLPACFSSFKQLSLIYLNDNKFTEFPEVLGGLTNLTLIEFERNELTEIPDCIGNLKQLSVLKVTNNKLEKISNKISQCTNLSVLMMEKNEITCLQFPFSIRKLDLSLLAMDDSLCDIWEHENFSPLSEASKGAIKGFAVMMGVEEADDEPAVAAKPAKSAITGPTPHDGTLCDAAYRKNLATARSALQNGANPNCRESEAKGGASPLWYAAINGQLELVELLHEYGADLDSQASDGETALHGAAGGGHVAVCKWLLEHGANKSLKTEEGEDAEEKARMSGWDECADFIKSWSGSAAKFGGAASASNDMLPPSDWRYKGAAYLNIAQRAPWVMFEKGTAVYFAPENKGTSAASLQKQAIDYLKAHADFPLRQNRMWGDYGYVRDDDDKVESTVVYGHSTTRPSKFGGEEDSIAIKIFISGEDLPGGSADFMIYIMGAANIATDVTNLKIVHTHLG